MANPIPILNTLFRLGQRQAIFLLLPFNVLLIVVMLMIERDLAPYTIVDFELAGTMENAQRMLNTWQKAGSMDSLFFLLGFDYLFMLVYSFSLWFVCLQTADTWQRLTKFMIVLAWLQPVAGVLDAIENTALYQLASGSTSVHWPGLALWCAVPKFVIALSALALWFVCEGIRGYRLLRR
jgi:hypothetical protein